MRLFGQQYSGFRQGWSNNGSQSSTMGRHSLIPYCTESHCRETTFFLSPSRFPGRFAVGILLRESQPAGRRPPRFSTGQRTVFRDVEA